MNALSLVSPHSISLNGSDNVGKSTQLAWLARSTYGASNVGSIDAWDAQWAIVGSGNFSDWWFVSSTTMEHVELVFRSHANRREFSGSLAFEDRGYPMLVAACAATASVKEGLRIEDAIKLVERLVRQFKNAPFRRETSILIRRFNNPENEAYAALARERNKPDSRYSAYQLALAQIIHLQVERGDYSVVITVGDAPIFEVQAMLRARLQQFDVAVPSLPNFHPNRVWVLGGLSESGKSTAGELLSREHETVRLKIGYLLEVAAAKAGIRDCYVEWSEVEQAERLVEELLKFADGNKARLISLESAHRFDSTRHLRSLLGDLCKIVYIHAPEEIRRARSCEIAADFTRRDLIKLERGAEKLAEIADHVIDNSGTLTALKFGLQRLVYASQLARAKPSALVSSLIPAYLQRLSTHLVDDRVLLVLATGSTATKHWLKDWSDVDILVVREDTPARWLGEVVANVPRHENVKTSVSVFTRSDVDCLRVPPRVVQALRIAADGTGVLYRRTDYTFVEPSFIQSDLRSRSEMGLVMMTLRRLIASPRPSIKDIWKHIILAAKILLRSDNIESNDSSTVISEFEARYPGVLSGLADGQRMTKLLDSSGEVNSQTLSAAEALMQLVDGMHRIDLDPRHVA